MRPNLTTNNHSVFMLTYHLVLCIKYRRKVIDQQMADRIKEKLHRPAEGTIKTCTIVRKNGKHYACFSCEVENKVIPLTYRDVGIDMGVKEFCITSDGESLPNPKNYRKAEAKLKKQQQSLSRKKKGSARRKKAVSDLAKTHEYIPSFLGGFFFFLSPKYGII